MNYLKQTDFKHEPEIDKAGCLLMTLLTIAQKAACRVLDSEKILFIYKHLIARGYMKPNCFIRDHNAVLNEGLSLLLATDIELKYVGAYYIDETLGTSWGKTYGDYIVLHVRTLLGNGHFRLMDYDPYEPSPPYERILSIRYYILKERENG